MSACYIDKKICTGARFSFCGGCMIAQNENKEEILRARTPLELTAAHIPHKRDRV